MAEDDDGEFDEDLIESEPPSTRTSELRRRLDLLVPASVGRKTFGASTAAGLAFGLAVGFLVGNISGAEPTERTEPTQTQAQEGAPPDGAREEAVVVVAFGAGFLTFQDLSTVGETVLSGRYGMADTPGLDGLCGMAGRPESIPVPQGPGGQYTVFGSASFVLVGATLTQRIGPDLDVLAASTLRGTVELAQSCSDGGDVTVRTDGIQTGIGDEYAVFSVDRVDPTTGEIKRSIVVLVRVGGRLVELTLTSESSAEVPDGLARVLRIAELAASRMLAG